MRASLFPLSHFPRDECMSKLMDQPAEDKMYWMNGTMLQNGNRNERAPPARRIIRNTTIFTHNILNWMSTKRYGTNNRTIYINKK